MKEVGALQEEHKWRKKWSRLEFTKSDLWRRFSQVILPLFVGLLFIWLWQVQLFHVMMGLKTYQLPLPSAILQSMVENTDVLLSYAGYTLVEAVTGLLLGSLLGFLFAVFATSLPNWGSALILIASSLNAVPIVALAPIMNLWFGDGIGSRVAVVTVITLVAMAINTYKGLNAVDPLALDLMDSYAASKLQIFRYLRFSNSLPYVFTALKINTTASMIGAIVSEFFFSSRGLGYLLSNSIKVAKMPLGWSSIVVAAVVGILFYLLVEQLEKSFLSWHTSQRS